MIPTEFHAIANHLWQSTLVAAVAGLLTVALQKNPARTRYWLWFAASAKFLVPFSFLVTLGSHFGRPAVAAPSVPPIPYVIEQLGQPFAEPVPAPILPSVPASSASLVPAVLIVIWAAGSVFVILFWWRRSRFLRAALRAASPMDLPVGIKVMSSNAIFEPGVFSIWRPVLLLPEGIIGHLTAAELDAILAHELCHVRSRDNLLSAIHMVVEAVFWFHPLVWWLGARLIEERENSCDEEVVRSGIEPQVYAEGILKVCELYLASPLPCVAGVTGSNLKNRIEAIMSGRIALKLSLVKTAALAVAGVAAFAAPIMVGLMNAPSMHAQPPQAAREFEVASVRPAKGGSGPMDTVQLNFGMANARGSAGGRFNTTLPLNSLIQLAYNTKEAQILGTPAWANSDIYVIDARTSGNATFEQMRPMLQSLLADRFKLTLNRSVKEAAVYELVVAKGGPKFEPSKAGSCITPDPKGPPAPLGSKICGGATRQMSRIGAEQKDRIQAFRISMPALIEILSDEVGRTIVDTTGLKGLFDVQLEFVPAKAISSSLQSAQFGVPGITVPSSGFSGPSVFTALRDQLGLQLESSKGPVEVLVVEHVEKPSPN